MNKIKTMMFEAAVKTNEIFTCKKRSKWHYKHYKLLRGTGSHSMYRHTLKRVEKKVENGMACICHLKSYI